MDEFFAQNRLSAYLDGELPEPEMAEVARAIESNPEVRRAYEEMRQAAEFLRVHGPVAAPPGLHMRVMREVDEVPIPRTWTSSLRALFIRLPREGLALAAVAALVFVLVWQTPRPANTTSGQEAAVQQEAPAPAGSPKNADTAAPLGDDVATIPVGTIPQPVELPAAKEQQAPLPASRAAELLGAGTSQGSPRSTPRARMPVPDEPYVPDWERDAPTRATISLAEPEPKAPALEKFDSGAPVRYQVHALSADALRQIVGVTERLGGRAYSLDGKSFNPYLLTNDKNHVRLLLRVPPDRIDSLEPYLNKIGAVSSTRPPDGLFSDALVDVEVEVLYLP